MRGCRSGEGKWGCRPEPHVQVVSRTSGPALPVASPYLHLPPHLPPAPLTLLLYDASAPSHKYYRLQRTPLPVLR